MVAYQTQNKYYLASTHTVDTYNSCKFVNLLKPCGISVRKFSSSSLQQQEPTDKVVK